jgi:hypothetical protein
VLLLAVPHAVFDEWSQHVLLHELRALYGKSIDQQEAQLPVLTTQYGDFARWQARWLESADYAQGRQYWITKLAGCQPQLALPRSRPQASSEGREAAHYDGLLDGGLLGRAEALALQESASTYTVLLTAFFRLLAELTGASDILVGCASSGRALPELEPLIGCFTNLLALRAQGLDRVGPGPLLAQVRETVIEALEHENVPFSHVVDAVGVERSLHATPLVQVAFGVREPPAVRATPSLVELALVDVPSTQARFDLTVWIERHHDHARCRWLFRRDLFSVDTVKVWHERFIVLLRQLAPEKPSARTTYSEPVIPTFLS